MPLNTKHRHSIRLPGCDYSLPGFYFITICTYQRECLFGEIKEGQMFLNKNGKIVEYFLHNISERFNDASVDEFIIMPNHIHCIILITPPKNTVPVGAIHELPLPQRMDAEFLTQSIYRRKMLLPKIIGYFKMNSAKQINKLRGIENTSVWQRNYFEHIIRNDTALQKIREYIINNPIKWFDDTDNPRNWKK